MRIVLTPFTMVELDRSDGASANTRAESAIEQLSPPAEGLSHLSTGSRLVDKLKARLDAVPDIRHERVAALRQAILDGSFDIFPERIASAMLADTEDKAG
jgi:negative regulator of flagellin synthesis FlgM